MRIIKLGIISLVFFAIFLTLLSFLFPSSIRISKAIDIRADKYAVMEQLSGPDKWKQWYSSADSFAVFGRNGNLRFITNIEEVPDPADLPLNAVISGADYPDTKRKGTGWNIIPGAAPNIVTVQWYMDFKLRWYPWEKFSGLLLEKRYGPVMEKGLENLKTILEK
ncbi:MAG: hypothetical protein HOP10_10765 [Chitinophagaceae bacterium]|nr:hypothetical protein [Chitinophagaceae bacterium]